MIMWYTYKLFLSLTLVQLAKLDNYVVLYFTNIIGMTEKKFTHISQSLPYIAWIGTIVEKRKQKVLEN